MASSTWHSQGRNLPADSHVAGFRRYTCPCNVAETTTAKIASLTRSKWIPSVARLWNLDGSRRMWGIRLRVRHLQGPKTKHVGAAATSKEEQERIDWLSKRGPIANPNDVIAYCDMWRSGLRNDQVSVLRNFAGGRKRTIGLTLSELRPAPNRTSPVVSKTEPFVLEAGISESVGAKTAISSGAPDFPR